MNLFDPFHFFWQVAGIDKDIVTAGFYANTELSPQVYSLSVLSIKSKLQEYIKSRVGSTVFQRYFADWAGHNCANMDYLTREQVGNQFCKKKTILRQKLYQYERGLLEISLAGDWSVFRPSVWEGVNQVGFC